MLEYCQGMGVC